MKVVAKRKSEYFIFQHLLPQTFAFKNNVKKMLYAVAFYERNKLKKIL